MSVTVTEREVAEFQTKATELAKDHGDFIGKLASLEKEGFDANKIVTVELVRMGRPDVALWLTLPEGRADAHALLNAKDDEGDTREVLNRLAGRLERVGFAQRYEPRLSQEDSYIQKRREDIRTGKRRTR